MKTILAAALALALTAGAAHAQDHSEEAKQSAMAADRAFSLRAGEVGIAKSFREYMSDSDALAFGGGGEPARGPDAIYQAQGGDAPDNGKLTWAPTEAWGSSSGDMAVTTGKWTFTPDDPAKAPRTGHYVTVWRKNGAAQWKGIVDIGNPDPPPPAPAPKAP
jgi:ketosteroid isomerase-like protein